MKNFVGEFVRQHGDVFGGGQVREQRDFPAFRNTVRGTNRFGIPEPDAERKRVGGEPIPVTPGIAVDFSDRGQRSAFGLAHVEDGSGTVTEKNFFDALPGDLFRLSFAPENRGKNGDAFFSLADVSSEFVPGVKPGHMTAEMFGSQPSVIDGSHFISSALESPLKERTREGIVVGDKNSHHRFFAK